MDQIFETLRTSSENTTRKQASAQLRQIQEQRPEEFLQYTWDRVSSADFPAELRFFLCTTVISFVTESWHTAVSRDVQERVLAQYVSLALQERFASLLLARKVGIIVALMSKRGGSGKTQPGQLLPSLVQYVATEYTHALNQHFTATANNNATSDPAALAQLLLMLHVFLKEIQTKRIGKVFESLCAELVQPLSFVFSSLGGASAGPMELPEVYLYLLKCSLRVFGCGVFEAPFYIFLLETTWKLAQGLDSKAVTEDQQRRLRLLEYAVKIQEKMVTYFPGDLQQLSVNFFVSSSSPFIRVGGPSAVATDAGSPSQQDMSLTHLLCSIVERQSIGLVSEKAACRALRLCTQLFSAEDGDEYIASVLVQFCQSPLMRRLMECMLVHHFPDDVSASMLQEWTAHPELAAEELDLDVDNEESAMCCSEQLFLAMTGSTGCAPLALEAAWAIVSELLAGGDERMVTAALHAIGIGYYTMSAGGDEGNSAYLQFMHTRLLPILHASVPPYTTTHPPTPFVLRRVVWLVGMWCESVTEPAVRRLVHEALEAMLQREGNAVVVLVALRSIENFVSDNNFTFEELTPTSVPTVLSTVQRVLPHLHSPSSVKALAGLVHVLVEKGAVAAHGEAIIDVFAPAVVSGIQKIEAFAADSSSSPTTAGGVSTLHANDDEYDDEEAACTSMLGMLLECLAGVVKICSSDAAIWNMFHPVVVPCTTPNRLVTPWAEDYAWELLLAVVRGSHSFCLPVQAEALAWCLQNAERDFAMLHICLRSAFALVVLHSAPQTSLSEPWVSERVFTQTQVEVLLEALAASPSPEVVSALAALLAAVSRMSAGPLRGVIIARCIALLLLVPTCEEALSSSYALSAATVLSISLQSVAPSGEANAAEQLVAVLQTHTEQVDGASTFAEQLVLLLDVAGSELVTQCIARVLVVLQSTRLLSSHEDYTMVQHALQGAAQSATEQDPDAEVRTFEEMLVELLGDEEVEMNSPHVLRLHTLFGLLC